MILSILAGQLVLCLISLFKKYGFAIKPFSLLRDHFRDVSFVQLNPARSASVQAVRRNRSATTRADALKQFAILTLRSSRIFFQKRSISFARRLFASLSVSSFRKLFPCSHQPSIFLYSSIDFISRLTNLSASI